MNAISKQAGTALRRCLTVVAVLVSAAAVAATAPEGDHSASPYFAVNSHDPTQDRLPLKNTTVEARILGVIADVVVTQHYRNEGSKPIAAQYVFPGSTRAAVYGMQVRLGERVLTAKIREKQQARVEFEQAKSAGKTAALLEQQRPNVFQMNVANIMPGDDVQVELRYTELISPTDGVYQFAFPTVVGPRYKGSNEGIQPEAWAAQGYERGSSTAFGLNVRLLSPSGVKEISSPSHQLTQQAKGDNETAIQLAKTGGNENNRDFVLNYRLASDKIETGILLSRGTDENFFLALAEPPKAVPTSAIVPREYVFVVDISGSMHGFPLDTTKVLMKNLLGGLRASDTFNLMLFSGDNTVLAPESLPATQANIERAIATLAKYSGGGSTEMLPALRKALAMKADVERARTFVVVTDGYVSVERDAFQLVRQNLDKANLFAFGIGSSVNRHLMEGLARAGQGEPFIVLNESAAAGEAERFRKMIAAPVLTHLKATFEGFDAYDVEPLALPDVFAQRPVILFGKWRGKATGKLLLEGSSANGPYRAELSIKPEQAKPENAALRYLWARHRVASLSDQEALEGGDGYRKDILDLGLRYNLLTQYTSFIAVDEIVRNKDAAATPLVDQPLPLPQGVGELAVGAQVPSTPEPAAWAMLAIAAAGMGVLAWLQRKQRDLA